MSSSKLVSLTGRAEKGNPAFFLSPPTGFVLDKGLLPTNLQLAT